MCTQIYFPNYCITDCKCGTQDLNSSHQLPASQMRSLQKLHFLSWRIWECLILKPERCRYLSPKNIYYFFFCKRGEKKEPPRFNWPRSIPLSHQKKSGLTLLTLTGGQRNCTVQQMHLFSAWYSRTICGSTKLSNKNQDENSSRWDMIWKRWPDRHKDQGLGYQAIFQLSASSPVQQECFGPSIRVWPHPNKTAPNSRTSFLQLRGRKAHLNCWLHKKKWRTARHKCKAGGIGSLSCLQKQERCLQQASQDKRHRNIDWLVRVTF